jgi:DNA-binding CsgD family transcriptional regulator
MAKTGCKGTLQSTNGGPVLRRSTGRPALLGENEFVKLRRDLSLPPGSFGFNAPRWSGNLLARYLARSYGVAISGRQGRRILNRIAPEARRVVLAPPAVQSARPSAAEPAASVQPLSRYPNLYQQQRALSRLRRLASFGLSAAQFAMALFDMVADAIPNSECKALHFSGVSPTVWWPWLTRGIDWNWAAAYEHYVTERGTQARALVDPMTVRSKAVYSNEEIVLPHFERSETYNELYRYWGFHHVLYVWGLDGGQFVGGLPIWRSAAMRPFTADDVRVATAISALIGHALSVAHKLESRHVEGGEFVSSGDRSTGIILITEDGRILALDPGARHIFGRIAVFDGFAERMILDEKIGPFLRYMGATMREIFSRHADGGAWLPPPNACLYLHRSGIALRFHGFVAQGDEGKGYYSVLVEAGELAEHRRLRLMLRYGLSPREFDVLRAVGQGRRGAEAAAALGVEPGTFYKYAHQLSEKLEIEDSLSLRSFAREVTL